MEYLKGKTKALFIMFITLNFNLCALEFLSSNGENYFRFNGDRNRIEEIDLDFKKKSFDIENIKFGFFINGKQFEIGEDNYEFELLDNSNIIEISGNFENIKYKLSLFSSMLNKNSIVFHTELISYKKNDTVSMYFYIKPKEIGLLNENDSGIRFNDINFKGEKSKVYLVDDTESKIKNLKTVEKETYIAKNQGFFIINNIDLTVKNETVLSIQKEDIYKNSITEEILFWENLLKNHTNKDLYSKLFMFENQGLIVDISGDMPIINMEHILKYLELTLLKKQYTESKKMMEYLLFNIDENIEGIIPSDYLDLTGKNIYKKDNYGIYNSYYRRSIFLKLYLSYLNESGDIEFYDKTFPIVKIKLIDWLDKKVGEKGVEADSGDGRIGADSYKNFVETQYETYKSFKLLNEFLVKKGIKEDKYKKTSEKLKQILILYYVDGVNISDFPFSKKINPKNIFYVDEDLFFSNNDYYTALQKNIDLLKKENSSLKEKVVFINYLYDKKYFLMAEFLKEEVEKELQGEIGTEILQKDLSLLINYLVMKEKGEKHGFDK